MPAKRRTRATHRQNPIAQAMPPTPSLNIPITPSSTLAPTNVPIATLPPLHPYPLPPSHQPSTLAQAVPPPLPPSHHPSTLTQAVPPTPSLNIPITRSSTLASTNIPIATVPPIASTINIVPTVTSVPSVASVPSVPSITSVPSVTSVSTSLTSPLTQHDDLLQSAHSKRMTCRWTDADDQTLINCLKEEKALHGSTSNGFKPSSWVQVAKALEGSELITGSKPKDKDTCKSRWQALKKQYMSFKTVASKSGAGWDEATKTITLPPQVWKELAANKSSQGRDLSRWENRPFPLYHDLAEMIEGSVATGELMEDTRAESPPAPSQLPMNPVELDTDDDDDEDSDDDIQKRPPLPHLKSTPTGPPKRKRRLAMTPDAVMTELKSLSTSIDGAMRAPIQQPASTQPLPPPTIHMQAIGLVQDQEGLNPDQIFEAIDFLADQRNAEVYISLNNTLRASWLKMKLGW